MENRTKRKRPEYLYAALLFIGAALLLVILIVCGSCEPKKEPAGENSAALSQGGERSIRRSVSRLAKDAECSSISPSKTICKIPFFAQAEIFIITPFYSFFSSLCKANRLY